VLPSDVELPARLDDVLMVCYALFTAGHLPTDGEAPLEAARRAEDDAYPVAVRTFWRERLSAVRAHASANGPAPSTIRPPADHDRRPAPLA
jgi:hypothetical protein